MEQRRFIQRTGPGAFRFRHALIRMAAYQSIAREDRAALHERLADWLDRMSPGPTPELNQMLGYHLAQALGDRRASGIGGAADARPHPALSARDDPTDQRLQSKSDL
jgi:hypothetical protein